MLTKISVTREYSDLVNSITSILLLLVFLHNSLELFLASSNQSLDSVKCCKSNAAEKSRKSSLMTQYEHQVITNIQTIAVLFITQSHEFTKVRTLHSPM